MSDSDQRFPAVRASHRDPRVERELFDHVSGQLNVLVRDVSKMESRLVRIEEKVTGHSSLRSDVDALRESAEVRLRETQGEWIDRLMSVERQSEARVRDIERSQAAADRARDEKLTTLRTQVQIAAVAIPLVVSLVVTLAGRLLH